MKLLTESNGFEIEKMENKKKSEIEIKSVVLGLEGSGKSCIIVKYTQHQFLEEYDPTIEDSFGIMITLKEKQTFLNILDTAGREGKIKIFFQQDLRENRLLSLKGKEGAIVLYSITNRRSFEETDNFIELAKSEFGDSFPIVLVGNKCDLEDERVVSKEDGNIKAKKYNIKFFETSAKTGINIENAFLTLAKQIRIGPQQTSKGCSLM
jgi:GTPase KRas